VKGWFEISGGRIVWQIAGQGYGQGYGQSFL
jgi:hypothetical protein